MLTIIYHLYQVKFNWIRTGSSCVSNNGVSSSVSEDFRVRYETHEEGEMTYQPKLCVYKDEVNNPYVLSNRNYQVSPQKFQQEICYMLLKILIYYK